MMIGSQWGLVVLAGLVLCVIAIIICGKAGMMKEKEIRSLSADDPHAIKMKLEYKFGLGIFVSIVSGVLSACFNFGLEAGKPMADIANEAWKAANPGDGEFLYRNNVIYVVLLWGGLTTNLIWCMVLNARNKSFGDYTNKKTPLLPNYIFAAIAGTTWFLQFFFYGMGESKLGNGASSWILHMAFIILVANMWGIVLKEWKEVGKKTKVTIAIGIITIILSVLVVGYGNKLHLAALGK
jgi:L-rhamnose-H+ transport protein